MEIGWQEVKTLNRRRPNVSLPAHSFLEISTSTCHVSKQPPPAFRGPKNVPLQPSITCKITQPRNIFSYEVSVSKRNITRRVGYRVIRSSVRTAHSFACSAALIRSFASLTHSFRSSWEIGFRLWNERVYFISFQPIVHQIRSPVFLLEGEVLLGLSPVWLMINEHELLRPLSHHWTRVDAEMLHERLAPTPIRRPDHASGLSAKVQHVGRREPRESEEEEWRGLNHM